MSKKIPAPRPDRERPKRLETEARDTAKRVDRIERELAGDRLGRIEHTIEAAAETNRATAAGLEEFRALVRGAFTIQQEQIANLYRTVASQQSEFAELRQSTAELRETVNQVIREWQAYLRTIHPPQ